MQITDTQAEKIKQLALALAELAEEINPHCDEHAVADRIDSAYDLLKEAFNASGRKADWKF